MLRGNDMAEGEFTNVGTTITLLASPLPTHTPKGKPFLKVFTCTQMTHAFAALPAF